MRPSIRMKGIIAVVVLGVIALLFKVPLPSIGYNDGYYPPQPIAYDHSLHAGQYQIPCLYCHTNAERSKHATVPSLDICMNCHQIIASDRPAIQKMQQMYSKNKSVEWMRVHLLPDFVKFNHKPHIRENISCQTCHGPVERMSTVYQYSDLSMGWCLDCHRKQEPEAPINCSTCHF